MTTATENLYNTCSRIGEFENVTNEGTWQEANEFSASVHRNDVLNLRESVFLMATENAMHAVYSDNKHDIRVAIRRNLINGKIEVEIHGIAMEISATASENIKLTGTHP